MTDRRPLAILQKRIKIRYFEQNWERVLEYSGYIDGKFVKGDGESFNVENPSDETVVDQVASVSLEQAGQAVTAARRAFDGGAWSGLSMKERARIMTRFGEAMRSREDRLRKLAVDEAGCPISSFVMMAQVDAPLRMTDDIIDMFLKLPEVEDNPVPMHERVTSYYQIQSIKRWSPVGVVSAISAYNVPLYTAFWKVVPALMAGNSVILRPNPLTPISSMIFAEAADEAGLPAGVFNLLIENGVEGGQLISTDPAVDLVSFTGSCAVGVKVAQQAAPTLKRLVLELGGKSAQIILPDKVDVAAQQGLMVCGSHAGQGCVLGTRIFVPEESKAEVLEKMAAMVSSLKIGRSDDPTTQLGPVISAAQRDRCEHFTKAAVDAGGTVVAGGKRPAHMDKGHFWEATVLDLPDNKNPAAQEEIFGPVVGVIGYRDIDHAVEMANDSQFGLSGHVYGADRKQALDVAMRLRTGAVNVNGSIMSSYVSAGGVKMSGLGRERGIEGLREFQIQTSINIGC